MLFIDLEKKTSAISDHCKYKVRLVDTKYDLQIHSQMCKCVLRNVNIYPRRQSISIMAMPSDSCSVVDGSHLRNMNHQGSMSATKQFGALAW